MQLGLREQIDRKGGQVPKKVIEAPFVQIPLGVTEDRLVGTVDIEASMKVSMRSEAYCQMLHSQYHHSVW